MSLVRFDPSTVTVKQSFIVSQIVICPVVLSWLVLLDSVNNISRLYGPSRFEVSSVNGAQQCDC